MKIQLDYPVVVKAHIYLTAVVDGEECEAVAEFDFPAGKLPTKQDIEVAVAGLMAQPDAPKVSLMSKRAFWDKTIQAVTGTETKVAMPGADEWFPSSVDRPVSLAVYGGHPTDEPPGEAPASSSVDT